MKHKESIPAILIERDYKGSYERFALTPEEFKKEYGEALEGNATTDLTVPNSNTIAPLVHVWYQQCMVGDRTWSKFFTDMTWELPTIDTDAGNIAGIRRDMMKSLLIYLPEEDADVGDPPKHVLEKFKIRVNETLSRVIDIDARTETEAIDIAIRKYHNAEIILDTTDMYEVTFTNEEDNEK